VGAQLYNKHYQQLQKRKIAEQIELEKLNEQRNKVSRPNYKSDQMIYQARKNKLGEIFEKLDSDQDGEISSHKIDLGYLSHELRNAFKPLLNELEALQQPLDKDEFIDASIRLYDVSTAPFSLYFYRLSHKQRKTSF
jgi:hypothetical protein